MHVIGRSGDCRPCRKDILHVGPGLVPKESPIMSSEMNLRVVLHQPKRYGLESPKGGCDPQSQQSQVSGLGEIGGVIAAVRAAGDVDVAHADVGINGIEHVGAVPRTVHPAGERLLGGVE